jgi:hypothetical protein
MTKKNLSTYQARLIQMSRSLANAYCPGIYSEPEPAGSDTWTSDKLVRLGTELSKGMLL